MLKYLMFCLDNLYKNRGKVFLLSILFSISFLLVGAVIYFYEYNNYAKNSADRLLTYGVEKSGIIAARTFEDDDLKKIVKDLEEIDEISVITAIEENGYYEFTSQSGIESTLIRTQRSRLGDKAAHKYGFKCMTINKSGWDLCNIKLASGLKPDEVAKGSCEYMLYLGSCFSGIDIGTELELDSGKRIVVQGILEEGQMYISKSMSFATNDIEDSLVSLDALGFLVSADEGHKAVLSPLFFFSLNDSAEWESAEEKIQLVFEKYDASYLHAHMSDVFDKKAAYSGRKMSLFHMLMCVVLVSLVIIQICTQMSEILKNQREYGIFYANGMSFKRLAGIIFIKNIIAFVMGLLIAIGLGIGAILFAAATRSDIAPQWNIVFEYAAVKIMLIQVLTFLAGLFIPLIWLYRMRPAQLIGGEE